MEKKVPQRQCMGCRERKDKKELIRVVRSADGKVKLDPTGRANGRGAYICPNERCAALAIKNRSLNRAFKLNVEPQVYDMLLEEFKRSYG